MGKLAYRSVRIWLVLALLPCAALALLPLLDLWQALFASGAPRATFRIVVTSLAEALRTVATPLVVWQLARALVDIADCQLLVRAERATK
ncbi:MAG: hypothetical protein INH34_07935 [Phycisphaerales bacterium]|nr:hypothetical protein [Phycisphaerales bacterium]